MFEFMLILWIFGSDGAYEPVEWEWFESEGACVAAAEVFSESSPHDGFFVAPVAICKGGLR